MTNFPISFPDVIEAQTRIRVFLKPTPAREYGELNEFIGNGIRIFIKHENYQPTNAFKVRNAFSAMTVLTPEQKAKGVVAASRGNHGQGVAYAAQALGMKATVCVPEGNNRDKNSAIRALNARLIEKGKDYDEAIGVMQDLVKSEGLVEIHSTNNREVLAGSGTITLEFLEEVPELDALVIAIGGGSQAVGAIVVAKEKNPSLKVYGVQAAGASAIYDSWHQGKAINHSSASTFADGLSTRNTYEMTFEALRAGLTDFITVTDKEIAESLRLALKTTHNLLEGAGAAGLAGAIKLREVLKGKKVGVIFSGANIDQLTLQRVLNREL